MSINIEVKDGELSVSSVFDKRDAPVSLTPGEARAMELVCNALAPIGVSETDFCCKRFSGNYLSVVTHERYDFLRVKVGVRSNWVSVYLSSEHQKRFMDDERFAAQKNKRQLHWKVTLDSIDQLEAHSDILQAGYQSAILSYQATGESCSK